MNLRPVLAAALVAVAATSLAGCGSTSSSSSSGTSVTASTSASAALTVADPWAKAATTGMTAAFGTLNNPGSSDVTVVSATTTASDKTELHEMVMKDGKMVMQPKEGGFVVPAGGSFQLSPSGNHIMIMDLKTPVKPGDVVKVTMTLNTGATVSFDATAKEFTGANESYQPGASVSMSMSMG